MGEVGAGVGLSTLNVLEPFNDLDIAFEEVGDRLLCRQLVLLLKKRVNEVVYPLICRPRPVDTRIKKTTKVRCQIVLV